MRRLAYLKVPFIAFDFWRSTWVHNGDRVTWAEAWHIALGFADAEARGR